MSRETLPLKTVLIFDSSRKLFDEETHTCTANLYNIHVLYIPERHVDVGPCSIQYTD